MKIYVVIPRSKAQAEDLPAIKGKLSGSFGAALRKYYGQFSPDSVEFFMGSSDSQADVYIMDKPRFSGYNSDIQDVVKNEVLKVFPNISVNVRVNYSAINPNFHPERDLVKKQTEAEQMSRRSGGVKGDKAAGGGRLDEFDYNKLSLNYQAEEPHYTFEQVILSQTTREQIEEAVGTIAVESKVFDEWGLRSIIPHASSAMSFYGPPGTGKSMAAEAVAAKLGKKILKATYADIESKYHGEGPKMVKAIFRAAEREDAVLFLDESDSLLSKRLTNVSDGSAQAINSMRSQLLICLEQFKGIVIFATNLVVNYDKAFLSRLINIEFTIPDEEAREAIWNAHLRGRGLRIPLDQDVDVRELAEKFQFCGREIKNAVKDACVITAMRGESQVNQSTLLKAAEKVRIESEKVIQAEDHTASRTATRLTEKQKEALRETLQKKLSESKSTDLKEIDLSQ